MNLKKVIIGRFLLGLLIGAAVAVPVVHKHWSKREPTRLEQITQWVKTYEPTPRVFCPLVTDRSFWKEHPMADVQKKRPPLPTKRVRKLNGIEISRELKEAVAQELTYGTGEWIPIIEYNLQEILDVSWTRGGGEKVSLNSSEVGATIAWAACSMRPKLNPVLFDRVQATLRKRMTGPFLKDFEEMQHAGLHWNGNMCPWLTSNDNWSAVCMNNILYIALAMEESPEIRAEFIHRAERVIENYLESIEEDGYINSGIRYWNYGFGHMMVMNERLIQATGGNITPSENPKIRRLAEFKQKALIGKQGRVEFTPLFADNTNPTTEVTWLESLCHLRVGTPAPPDPILHNAVQIGAQDLMNKICRKIKPGNGITAPTESTAFESLGVLISRNPGNKTTFAIQGGKNYGEHNHNDMGSYTLFVDNYPVIGDWGTTEYTGAHYSNARYEFPHLGSYGHPVPVVDNHLQVAGAGKIARVLKRTITPEVDSIEYDLTPGYSTPGLKSLTRTVVVQKTNPKFRITITDRFECDYPISFETPVIFLKGKPHPRGLSTDPYEITFSSDKTYAVNTTSFWLGKEMLRRSAAKLDGKFTKGYITTIIEDGKPQPAAPKTAPEKNSN